MCFRNDYDWYAELIERDEPVASEPVTCDECGDGIPRGQKYHHVYMQQSEECRACFTHGNCDCPASADGTKSCEDDGCQCAEPSFGETFEYNRCDNCHRFLEAIESAEVAAGCKRDQSRPALTEMMESVKEIGAKEAKRYWQQAARLYPSFIASGYLISLWRRMFKVYR